MKGLTEWITLYFFNSVWQVPVLLGCTVVTLKLFPRAAASLQYRLWVTCLVLAVALPALSASSGTIQAALEGLSPHASVASDGTSTGRRSDDGPLTLHFTEIAVPSSSRTSGRTILTLYLLSLLTGAAKLAAKLRRTGTLVRTAARLPLAPSARNYLARSALALGIAPVDVFASANLHAPATVSWPKPMLLVPAEFNRAPNRETATVIAHELAHICRKDFEINLVLEALAIFIFYNPATYWIKRQLAEAREMVCDELAAESTEGRTAYARSLLILTEAALSPSKAASLSLGVLETSNLEKRIMKLLEVRSPVSGARKALLTVSCWSALSACAAGLILLSLHPTRVQAARSPTFLYDPSETPDVLTPTAARKVAPDFTLTDAQGKSITLSDYKGRVVLLDFWATWCGGCKLEIPWYIEFDKKYRDQGLAVIGVSMDEDGWAAVKPFLAKKRDDETGGKVALGYPIVIGSDALAKRYDVTSLPMTLLIDRQGKIAGSHTGVVNRSDFESHIQMLLK